MNRQVVLKHLLTISCIVVLVIFALGSATTPSKVIPAFTPQNGQDVIVRMNNGRKTAYIDNEKYSIQISQDDNKFKDGIMTFFVAIRNNMKDSMIIARYEDFKLQYNKNGRAHIYSKTASFDEYINAGYRSQYLRDRMYPLYYEHYFRENDIAPNGDYSAGVISFPYDDFDSFTIIVNITIENLVFRRVGEYTKDVYRINFKK